MTFDDDKETQVHSNVRVQTLLQFPQFALELSNG